VHHKKLRSWIVRWRRRTGVLIFIQRSQSVIRIQTLYRTWRDRRKFIAMHLSKTFMGVLSDVYLGPKRRGLDYYVPDVIRNDRRLLWLAATIIQTVYRYAVFMLLDLLFYQLFSIKNSIGSFTFRLDLFSALFNSNYLLLSFTVPS